MEVPRVSRSNRINIDMMASWNEHPSSCPPGSDCYGIIQLFLAFASGFPLSQCFFLLGALAEDCDIHNPLAKWSVSLW